MPLVKRAVDVLGAQIVQWTRASGARRPAPRTPEET